MQRERSFTARPIVYRIFLASPGDVRDERELARVVIEQLRGERAFRGRIDLQYIAWDQPGVEVAMEANLTQLHGFCALRGHFSGGQNPHTE